MADKVVIEAEVKSNVGEVGKDAASAAGEFRVMGVSLNSVKAGLTSVGKTAKASFATIKAGIMSTGIGALVIAVAALVSHFTNTKRGADQLDQAFTAIGATVDVLKDRMSKLGEAIKLVFSGEFKKAGDALKETFSGITEEIKEEVVAMTALTKRTQALRDADMAFMVQKAKTRQEIEKARLIAEDETKSAKERLDNLKVALELEEKTTQRELQLARERVAIQAEEMAQSENLVEDEQKLAQLRVELIEKETASVKMRRRVVTEVNSLEREILAEEKARAKEKQDIIDAEWAAKIKANDEWNKEQERLRKKELAEEKKIADEKKKLETDLKNFKVGMAQQGLSLIQEVAGEGTALAKTAAVAQATISGVQGVQNAFTAANANVALTAATAGGYPIAMATAAGLFSALQIKKILSGSPASGSDAPTPSVAETSPPAPQMMSGAFELGGGIAPEPVKAYVVTDEMTNSQDQLANIRRRATI
tara:strand:- start:1247 stop:2683 length:1437 start_codon:yes stop_codon:yes gene_type:complete